MKRSVILTDRLGLDILLVLTMKRQVLHRERAYLKERQVRGDQEQVNWTDKAPQSKRNITRSQSQSNGKELSRK